MNILNRYNPNGSDRARGSDVHSPSESPVEQRARVQREMQEAINQADIAEGVQPPQTDESPPEETPSADEIIGKLTRAKTEERKVEILEEHGVDASEGFDTWEDLEAEVERVTTKQIKQSSVTGQATVGVSGIAVPAVDDADSISAELNDLFAGKHGSVSTPRNQKRMQELTAKLNQIDPPVNI